MNRREFVRKGFRVGILAGMTGGVVFLAKRNKIDYSCTLKRVCQSCSLYSGCDLDKAKESRRDER
ncbi:MAG TPA: hypothetical protein VKA27_04535 [Sunxiuqinia sp.]|nr:hypothetical protein [Sunxiuqinia sp.]